MYFSAKCVDEIKNIASWSKVQILCHARAKIFDLFLGIF